MEISGNILGLHEHWHSHQITEVMEAGGGYKWVADIMQSLLALEQYCEILFIGAVYIICGDVHINGWTHQ